MDDLESSFERDVTLSDGSVLHIRPVRSDDVEQLRRLHDEDMNDTSAYYRFFGARPLLTDSFLGNMATFKPWKQASIVGLRDERIVAIGSYSRGWDDAAEVVFSVADSFHGLGIGTVLLEDLAVLARASGFTQLTARALAGNGAMIEVFRRVGLTTRYRIDAGIMELEMDLLDDTELARRSDEREWAAQAASMRPYLAPQSVVVIGASRDPMSPGHRIVVNAQRAFTGDLAVVRPDGAPVAGVKGYRSVAEVPFKIDLAVIVVPARAAPQVLEECGRAGVRATVVITAGFSETGAASGITDAQLVTIAHGHGMRLLGPNCFGLIAPAVGLDVTFSTLQAKPGGVAFGSQSGGLGVAVLVDAAERGIGLSSFVSLGNRADVSSNDLLCAWADDPTTRVILLYLEFIGNPRRFLRIARNVTARKPIVIVKAGRSAAGRRGAASHTAALASDDDAVDALFEAAGVIRVDTLDQMMDVAQLLDRQSAPRGRRVGLVGNSGGPLILAADASEARGLVVPTLSDDLRRQVRELVPTAAATANPIDLLATVSPQHLADVVGVVARSGEVDAVVVAAVGLRPTDDQRLDDALRGDSETVPVPVAVSVSGVPTRDTSRAIFQYSESAVGAIAHALTWTQRRERIDLGGDVVHGEVDWLEVRRLVRKQGATPGWLTPEATGLVMAALGIAQAESGVGRTPDEVAELAIRLGASTGSVVLKAVVPGLLHKTEAGAVLLGVAGHDAAIDGYTELAGRFPDLTGVLVQTQVPTGPELLVGARQDASAGPLVVVAAGGIEAELHADRAVRAAPLSLASAKELLLSLRTAPRLTGYRGSTPVDVDALTKVVARVARLVAVVPEVVEFEINPLVAGPLGATAVDVRMRTDPATGVATPLRGE